jgi:5-formyltetrahydrofolate cyclo-ligase
MMITKRELRGIMKSRLAELPAEVFKKEGEAAAETLFGADIWKRGARVLLFASMEGEISASPLFERALAEGKEIYFPKTEGNGTMSFFRVKGEGDFSGGAFGIREPSGSADTLFKSLEASSLVVTPGLAFDRRGNRMGRGRGYYDRFFAALDSSKANYRAVGFCLPCQIVPEVPVEPFDRRLDALAAGGELLFF